MTAPCDRCGRVECPRPAAEAAYIQCQISGRALGQRRADCTAHVARLPSLLATERAARLDAERRAEGLAGALRDLRERVAAMLSDATVDYHNAASESADEHFADGQRDAAGDVARWIDEALTAHAAKGE